MFVFPTGTAGLAEIKRYGDHSIHKYSDLPLGLGPFEGTNASEKLEINHLKPNHNAQIFLDQSQRFIDAEVNFKNFKQHGGSSYVKSGFSFSRNTESGKIELDEFEMQYFQKIDLNCENSTSLQREPLHQSNFVRGKSTNLPFQPGGFEHLNDNFARDDHQILEFDSINLYHIPPGFERGINFSSTQQIHQLNIHELFSAASDPLSFHANESNEVHEKENKDIDQKSDLIMKDVDSFLPEENLVPSLLPKKLLPEKGTKEWVHMVDVNLEFPEFEELVPEMAHDFTFELDTFQKRAVYHLEKSESVFIAAHTSAGKTVVAEYAIALAMKHMTRAVYTSPIKALSNQKYRDFKYKFDDVGILTGDIQINPEASCLIMTTEILRSMLYRGADLIRDVEFVIFDEVHYLNDSERGVVWEEVIIMLPEHVTLILLSATVPNTKEFAEWIGRTKKKNIYVISTLKRPVPLEHFLFADREAFQIVDSNKCFLTSGYKKVNEIFHPSSKKENQTKVKGRNNYQSKTSKVPNKSSPSGQSAKDKNMYVNLISFLKKKDLLPVIVFAFSKRKCEEYAQALNNLDLTSGATEKAKIHIFVQQSLACLNGSDKELPQILRLTELLMRGIAVHHSGLLPILKEIVEILFTRGLVKVLFATETFAMGVNAPAKTVVFAMIRKHDGANFRQLLPGEYTQMAGRAGRRGLDTTGVVIIACANDVPDELELRNMILGKATKLESQFRVTYNMILNLLRVEAIKVEDMIKRSFSENAAQKELPEQERKHIHNLKKLSKIQKLECGICTDIRGFYEASYRALTLGYRMQDKIINHPIASKALSCGRIVLINTPLFRNALAVILKAAPSTKNISFAQTASRNITSSSLGNHRIKINDSERHFWVALACSPNSKEETDEIAFPVDYIHLESNSYILVELIPFSAISIVTSKQIKIQSVDEILSKKDSDMRMLLAALFDTRSELRNDGILEYDWSKIRDLEFQEQYRERSSLLKLDLKSFQCIKCPELLNHYGIVHQERKLQETVRELEHNMSDLNLELLPDYHQRISVLKELQFIDENSIVQIKGRVACEINTADELILTELILENFLNDFDASEIVALLSCFVFQEKSQSEPILTPNLQRGIERIKQTALKVAQIQRSNGIDILPEEAIENLKFGLVEVVHEWARGLPFKHITDLTDVLEGSIVRCIVRLSETCREVSSAARLIGDGNLFKKLEEAALLIKRDIVFAASLYF